MTIILQPTVGQLKARPQALAWNSGTMGIITSVSAMPNMPGEMPAMVCMKFERWV